MYIRSTGNISPQMTFGHQPLLSDPVIHSGNRLYCKEPEYKDIIDVKMIRRMSRIIRMGVAAAFECLAEADVKQPGAIVTGTAYGCLEDTGVFLTRMVEFKEELLTPTAFIQSTHNTIGAQIGLMLACNNYNNAFVHRGFSFESALMDARLLLDEQEASDVLVGAIDEITDISHAILQRMGLYKTGHGSNLDIFSSGTKGTIAGEGAAFFLVSNEHAAGDYAKLDAFTTFYKPNSYDEIEKRITDFIQGNSLQFSDIDLVITGKNGDQSHDQVYERLHESVFRGIGTVNYKQLCGEYPTSTGFACWLAACILRDAAVPAIIVPAENNPGNPRRILVYNHYLGIHHSLFLLSAC